ncbi:MAG: 16S rRNA (cytosine(1402)-N(4))-methyltransferase RsmH [Vicingaceae bacterium]
MLKESTEALKIKPEGIYVDATFGGGGHSKEILKHLKGGKLYAFDQDNDSASQVMDSENLVFIDQNFRYLKNFLKIHQALPVDGILADLGISSHQIDVPGRGFSFREDGPLDMRMNQNQELTAHEVINQYELDELTRIFRQYGELKEARRLAKVIVEKRQIQAIDTIKELIDCVQKLALPHKLNKFLAKLFQAIRIEVNGEMDALKELLSQCPEVLKNGGIMAFITYHSLEDRLVKNFIRSGRFDGELEKDFYGNVLKPLEAVNRKPIVPSEEEVERNNRARSAKLRIARKIPV